MKNKRDGRRDAPHASAKEQALPDYGNLPQLLRGIGLFANFTDAEIMRLADVGRVVNLKQWAYAIIEGEPTRGMFIILEGRVSIYKTDQTSANLIRLATFEAGGHFGEFSLFDQAPRSATVAAETACRLFELDAGHFKSFTEREGPDLELRFYRTCAEELAARFRSLNGDYLAAQRLLWKFALRKDAPALKSSAKPVKPPELGGRGAVKFGAA